MQCGTHPQPHGRAVGSRYSPIQVIQVIQACQAAEHSRMRLRFPAISVEFGPHYVFSSAHLDCNPARPSRPKVISIPSDARRAVCERRSRAGQG